MKTMREELTSIVAEVFDLDDGQVDDALTPEDVDTWDSLNHLKLVSAVEQAFDVHLSMAEVEAIDSVGALASIIAQHRS